MKPKYNEENVAVIKEVIALLNKLTGKSDYLEPLIKVIVALEKNPLQELSDLLDEISDVDDDDLPGKIRNLQNMMDTDTNDYNLFVQGLIEQYIDKEIRDLERERP